MTVLIGRMVAKKNMMECVILKGHRTTMCPLSLDASAPSKTFSSFIFQENFYLVKKTVNAGASVLRMRPVKRDTTEASAASRNLAKDTRRLHTDVQTGLPITYKIVKYLLLKCSGLKAALAGRRKKTRLHASRSRVRKLKD